MRRKCPYRIDVLGRDVMPRQDHDIELVAARSEQHRYRARIRVELHLDAELLQRHHIGLTVLEIVGGEADLAAQIHQDFHDLLHSHRPGVLVGRQHAGVDHQHP